MIPIIAEHIKTHRHQLRKHALFIGSTVRIPPDDVQIDKAIERAALEWAGDRVAGYEEDERAREALRLFAESVTEHDVRCKLLEEVLGPEARPAEGHVRLARLIKDGYYSSVFLSEPDDMLERALRAQHMEPGKDYHLLVAGVEDPKDIRIALEESTRISIVKCGGDLHQRFLPVSTEEITEVARSLETVLGEVFKLFSVFVAMSDRDTPFLERIPREGGKIFWINRMIPMADAELYDELRIENPASAEYHRYQPHVMALLEARHSSRHLLCREPGSFNDFFAKLHGRLVRHRRRDRGGRRDMTVLRGGPFRFLDHFNAEDEDFYFGREADVSAVVEKIHKKPLTVLFGTSGIGKTSLLRAGVFNALRKETEEADTDEQRPWLVVYARVGDDPRVSIQQAIIAAVEETGFDTRQLAAAESCSALISKVVERTGRRVVILLDQFAEYFVKLGARVRRRSVIALKEALEHCPDDFRLLIAIREDYLGELFELEKDFPEIMHNMHRLRRLTREQAEDAIIKPAQNFEMQVERSLVHRIINDLYRDGVEPYQLQIILHSLYESLSPGGRVITERTYERVGSAREVLEQYLQKALAKLPGNEKRTATKVLVFLASGSELKASQTVDRIIDEVNIDREMVERALAHLVDLGLLRPVGRGREREYELVHEILADRIEKDLAGAQVLLRDIQDLLTRELNSYEQFGLLTGPEELRLIGTVRDDLVIGPDELRLIVRSALTREVDADYWFKRLWELRDGKSDFVARLMRDDEPQVRRYVYQHLSDHLEARLIRHLVHGLDDELPEVRELATTYLRQLDRHLLSMLANSDFRVRALAARAAAAIGDRRFVKPLIEAFVDDAPELRDEITAALIQIDDPRTADSLLKTAVSGHGTSWALAFALGRLSVGEDELAELRKAWSTQRKPQLLYALTVALIQRRHFQEAEEALEQAAALSLEGPGATAFAEVRAGLEGERAKASAGEDIWPMFGRSAAHRAMTPQQVSPPLEVAWHFQTDDQVVASPVVRDHLAYVGSRDKKLYAIDTGKGSARWSFLAGDRLEGAAAVTEDLVCVGALSGSVYGVDVASGQLRWKASLGASIRASCAIEGDSLFIGTRSGKLFRLDVERGDVAWEQQLPGEISASTAVADGIALVGCWDGALHAHDAASGAPLWAHRTQGPISAAPSIADGVAYCGSDDNSLYALTLADGNLLWKRALPGHIRSAAAVGRELVIFGCVDGRCYALSRETGDIVWATPTEEEILASPAISGDIVYIGSRDGALYALDRPSGEVLWRHKTSYGIYSSPAVAEQTVFIGLGYYGIAALRPETRSGRPH